MGTRFELVLAAPSADRARAQAAGEAALERIEECDRRLSAFRRDSLVSRINREAAHAPVRVDAETGALLELCLHVWRATRGAFDPALGASMEAWGFRGRGASARPAEARGEPYELDSQALTVRFTRRDARLDLGAVAKGFALDLAASELREAGVDAALLHGGTSSAIAIGAPPGRTAWGVAISTADGTGPIVPLRDDSLSVSAPHGRTVAGGPERGGARLGHLIDPALGRPLDAEDRTRVTCVLAPSAALSDAWATGLCVLTARGEELPELDPDVRLLETRNALLTR